MLVHGKFIAAVFVTQRRNFTKINGVAQCWSHGESMNHHGKEEKRGKGRKKEKIKDEKTRKPKIHTEYMMTVTMLLLLMENKNSCLVHAEL